MQTLSLVSVVPTETETLSNAASKHMVPLIFADGFVFGDGEATKIELFLDLDWEFRWYTCFGDDLGLHGSTPEAACEVAWNMLNNQDSSAFISKPEPLHVA